MGFISFMLSAWYSLAIILIFMEKPKFLSFSSERFCLNTELVCGLPEWIGY